MSRRAPKVDAKAVETARVIARAQIGRWLANGRAKDAEEINRGVAPGGNCDDFAGELASSLEQAGLDASDLSICQFLKADREGDREGTPFDRGLLRKHWKSVTPPHGTTWEDWDELSEVACFNNGTHVFTYVAEAGLFLDSECPEGVANFLELPFFNRSMESWREDREATASP